MRAVYAGTVDASTRFRLKNVADRQKPGANGSCTGPDGARVQIPESSFSTDHETVRSDPKGCSGGFNGWELGPLAAAR